MLSFVFLVSIYLFVVNSSTTGKATWYGGNDNSGACGYSSVPSSTFPFGYYAAVGSDNFDSGYQCGACYTVQCIGAHESDSGSGCDCITTEAITLQIMDWCPECDNTHFDLAPDARNAITTCDVTEIQFERTDCSYTDNIVIRNKEGTSQYWYAFHIDNVSGRGAINEVGIKSSSDSDWDVSCDKSSGPSFWVCNNNQALPNPTLPLDIKFIDDEANELIAYGAITSFESAAQFDTGVNY